MGTLMRNRQVVGGTPVVDTALDSQSTDVVQNKVVAEAISTINSNLDNKIGAKGAKLLSIITTTGEQNINISDYAFIIIQLTAYGAAYPIGTQIIFDNCTEVGLGKDNGFTSNYGALLSVSFTNNKINLKSIAGTSAQVRIYGVFPK